MESWSSISVLNNPWLSTTRRRQENQQNHHPDLTVGLLINENSQTWNSEMVRALVHQDDTNIIENIPLSRTQMIDKEGCHFTKMEIHSKIRLSSGESVP